MQKISRFRLFDVSKAAIEFKDFYRILVTDHNLWVKVHKILSQI